MVIAGTTGAKPLMAGTARHELVAEVVAEDHLSVLLGRRTEAPQELSSGGDGLLPESS